MLSLEIPHILKTVVDAVRLEADEVEPAAGFGRMRLPGEVDELGKGAADLR
jgi:hypothetical protein